MQHVDLSKISIVINSASVIPASRQISSALRRAIIDGQIAHGAALPSMRTLATDLGVSPTTVSRGIEDLLSQGYLIARRGKGTFVCERLPGELAEPLVRLQSHSDADLSPLLSTWAKRLVNQEHSRLAKTADRAVLLHGGPPLDLTPINEWRQLLEEHSRLKDPGLWSYAAQPLGYPPLRDACAAYLRRARAVKCDAESVIVFSARELRLDIACRALIEAGDNVAIEDPGYPAARQRFASHGARLVPIPVDAEGMCVDILEKLTEPVKMVYISPSHHEPTGAVLSVPRRKRLLEWAQRTGAWIFEDDYDSEFRHSGRPVPSIQSMDTSGCVIYQFCFWRVLSHVTRLGFLIVPPKLQTVFAAAKEIAERDFSLLDQFAMTDFINGGHLERHIRRLRKLYAARRDALVERVRKRFGIAAMLSTETAGLDMLISLQSQRSDEEVVDLFREVGVDVVSASPYFFQPGHHGLFIIPFSDYDEETLVKAIDYVHARLVREPLR